MTNQTKVVVRSGDFGVVWFIGWLFTIGYVKLAFWKAVAALILWPYYLGAALTK